MEYEIEQDEPVSTAVVRTVSAVEGREPCSLQPLSDVIDPDALDALFASRHNDASRSGGWVSFSYSSCHVRVHDGTSLTVEPEGTGGVPPTRSNSDDVVERSHPGRERQTATDGTPGSRICFVCQQPIQREHLQREQGELVHDHCSTERRRGISMRA